MVAYPERNFGFLLKLETEEYYRAIVFASNDHSNSALWPELTITYQLGNPLPDAKFNSNSANYRCDSVSFELNIENQGSADLTMPYYITLYKDVYRGGIIYTHAVYDNLNSNANTRIVIKLPVSRFQGFEPITNLVFALNDMGDGVAQNGGQQKESDITNNTYTMQYTPVYAADTLAISASICKGERYTQHGFNVSVSGDYTLKLKNQSGCDSVIILHLAVNPLPDIKILSTNNLCDQGFADLEIISNGDSFLWNTGSTETSITVLQSGVYYATASLGGCERTAYYTMTKCPCIISIPNAFSPNDDGINDVFNIKMFCPANLVSFQISIFSRWGELIYQSSDANFSWDGRTANGTLVPVGAYLYIIEYKTANEPNRVVGEKGSVTIIP